MNENLENILLIGFGSGILAKQYQTLFKKLKNFDVVDIEENILQIAEKYFNFVPNKTFNFHLQDAIVFLKTTKKKYDLIVADVAGDEGIDERFCEQNYLELIKKHLKKDGIFISNMPSSRDIFNKKNKFVNNLFKLYKKNFKNTDVYSGETSNKIFYKTFYNIEEIVYDVTNLILISSDKNYEIKNNGSLAEIVAIEPFLKDFIKKV